MDRRFGGVYRAIGVVMTLFFGPKWYFLFRKDAKQRRNLIVLAAQMSRNRNRPPGDRLSSRTIWAKRYMRHSLNPEISVGCGSIELFCNNASLALPCLLDHLGLLGHEKKRCDDA